MTEGSRLLLDTLRRSARPISVYEIELSQQNIGCATNRFLNYLSRQVRHINDNVNTGDPVNFAEFYDAVSEAYVALNDQIKDIKGKVESQEAGDL